MKGVSGLWQGLPPRHRWTLVVLLVLVLLALMLKSCAADSASTQLQAPPLPPLPASAPDASPTSVPTTATNDLRLAERRPQLTSPGLEFVDHAAPKVPQQTPHNTSTAVTPATSTTTTTTTTTARAVVRTPTPAQKTSSKRSQPNQSNVSAASKSAPKKGLFAALPADAWLLQVAAAPNENEARTRCRELALPCVSYAAMRHARQVWILVVGPYASREAALAAVAKLPLKLREQGPFARQVADVRKDAGG